MMRVLAFAAAVVLVLLPALADNYVLRVATTMLMYSALALGWNFIGGFAGYPSFATAAFFGLGAYASGVLQTMGVPMPAAWALGGAIVALFAAALGRAILHLRGHYFAIASLVVAEVLREITNSATDLTGGGMGLNLPVLSLDVTNQARLFYYAMFFAAAAALATTAFVALTAWDSAALHSAERRRRDHARDQYAALQGRGLRPVGGVSGRVRRHLRLLGQLHRSDRCL